MSRELARVFETDTRLLKFWDGSAWVVISRMSRNTVSKTRDISADNTWTNQNTPADFPVGADKTALDITLTKVEASSSVRVHIDVDPRHLM